jgi:hypothetical protein
MCVAASHSLLTKLLIASWSAKTLGAAAFLVAIKPLIQLTYYWLFERQRVGREEKTQGDALECASLEPPIE